MRAAYVVALQKFSNTTMLATLGKLDSKDKAEVETSWVLEKFGKKFVNRVNDMAENDKPIALRKSRRIYLDDRQITRLRLKKKKDGTWYYNGMLSDSTVINLTEEYVRRTYSEGFLATVVWKQDAKGLEGYQDVTPGNTRCNNWLENVEVDKGAPKLKYVQGDKQTCLLSGAASAFYFLGLKELAKAVSDMADKYHANGKYGYLCWKKLQTTVHEMNRELVPTKILRVMNFDLLNDISSYPTVVQLEGSDGTRQHAVTIVGKYIFDATCKFALPLEQYYLNYCCSADGRRNTTFVRVFKGIRFAENKEKVNKILNTLKKDYNRDIAGKKRKREEEVDE